MSHLELSTIEELITELASRFEAVVIIGKKPHLNVSDNTPEESLEDPYYNIMRGDAADLNWMCDMAKRMVMDEFLGTGREPEAWER